jgi:hypothetical protein
LERRGSPPYHARGRRSRSASVLGRSEARSPGANELFHVAVCSRVAAGRRPVLLSTFKLK